MTLKFGFELEGFFEKEIDGVNQVTVPDKGMPTDGFPGLIEHRNTGPGDLEEQYFSLLNQFRKLPFDLGKFEHVFSGKDRRLIRARDNVKDSVEISNIYGKEPKDLKGRTIASFQINISDQTRGPWTDDKGVKHAAEYALFDFVPVIRRLDDAFKQEISRSKRQPGFYSVKENCRVEYRSLPNSVFEVDIEAITNLLNRISKAVKGED